MASLSRSALRPQCTSCVRRFARQGLDAWGPQQQARSISKKAKEAERNIIVKLLQDVPRFGRAGMEGRHGLEALLMLGQDHMFPSTQRKCAIDGSPPALQTTFPLAN